MTSRSRAGAVSLRREMLQVARLAPTSLGDSRELVSGFLRGSVNPDGGFRDRSGESDLYYTVFGVEGLIALKEAVPTTTTSYLHQFADGTSLDFVHLTCLARAWRSVSKTGPPDGIGAAIRSRLNVYRSADGGFSVAPAAQTGSAYACFLALGACEDLGFND